MDAVRFIKRIPDTDLTYGYKPVQTKRVKTIEIKGDPEPAYADSLSLTIPYDIYLVQNQGNGALAQCALLEDFAGNFEDAFINCSSAYDNLLDVPYCQEEADSLSGVNFLNLSGGEINCTKSLVVK